MCTTSIRAGLVIALLSSGVVLALEAPPAAPTQGAESDRAFLQQALGVNELEVRLGRLAAERGSTPEVKAQGQKMVKNHTALGRELSDMAKQSGLSGTAELSPDQQETLARMESQSGTAFDTAFKQTVDAGHVKELAMYRGEVDRAANPQLRNFAERRVAALQKAVAEEQSKKMTQ